MQRALTTDVAFLIDSTIQQSMATNYAATEKINYYKLLGGEEPLEEWETYDIEVKQLEMSNERVTKAQHSRLLTDAKEKTDPFFYIRSANSNLEDTAMTKLLINKVTTGLEAHATRQARSSPLHHHHVLVGWRQSSVEPHPLRKYRTKLLDAPLPANIVGPHL
jgi:hypothetical protein